MILESSSVDLINAVPENMITSVVEQVSLAVATRLSDASVVIADVVCLPMHSSLQQSLCSSLGCTAEQAQQLCHCISALVLKCGTLTSKQSLACCGVKKTPADAMAAAYSRHHHIFAPHLAALTSTPRQEVFDISSSLSVITDTFTLSRLCTPQALLQFTSRTRPLEREAEAATVDKDDKKEGVTEEKLLLQLDKDELLKLYEKLEEMQNKLDSFQ